MDDSAAEKICTELGAKGAAWDWDEAFNAARAYPAEPGAKSTEERFSLHDVAEIIAQFVEYGGTVATEVGHGFGTELSLDAVLRLKDGRYAALTAWNDYTGWGCRDGSEIRLGPLPDVIAYGLDKGQRERLGFSEPPTS